jgi:phage protein D
MPDTRTVIAVGGSPLSASDLFRVQSVHVEETLGAQDKVSIAVAMDTDNRSGWTSPLDALVAPAKPFTVTLTRGQVSYSIDARSVSASWNLVAGGLSTLTVEGMDRSVEMDRKHFQCLWDRTTDSAIASTLFSRYGLALKVGSTPARTGPAVYSPQQNKTDWAFLQDLAGRNGFDVRVETIDGTPTGVFERINPKQAPQTETSIDLGYGELGGTASASVQLLASQEVHVTRSIPDTGGTDSASDLGTKNAMAEVSLGRATTLHANAAAGVSVVDAQTTATAMAERSAFAANLTATLAAPNMPLLRARRTVTVRGLGSMLDGLWLVKSVTHQITPAGHTQALALTRNALGAAAGSGGAASAAGRAAAPVGPSL